MVDHFENKMQEFDQHVKSENTQYNQIRHLKEIWYLQCWIPCDDLMSVSSGKLLFFSFIHFVNLQKRIQWFFLLYYFII